MASASKSCSKPGCRLRGTKACSACGRDVYCTADHQKDDWKAHKTFCAKVLPLGSVSLADALVVLTESAATCRIPEDDQITVDVISVRRLTHIITWGEEHCPPGTTTSASPAWEADLRLCEMYRYLSSAYRQMHVASKATPAGPYFASQALLYLGKVVDRMTAAVLPDPFVGSSSQASAKGVLSAPDAGSDKGLAAAATAATAATTTATTATTTTTTTTTPTTTTASTTEPLTAAQEAWNTRHHTLQTAHRALAILQLVLLPPISGTITDHPQIKAAEQNMTKAVFNFKKIRPTQPLAMFMMYDDASSFYARLAGGQASLHHWRQALMYTRECHRLAKTMLAEVVAKVEAGKEGSGAAGRIEGKEAAVSSPAATVSTFTDSSKTDSTPTTDATTSATTATATTAASTPVVDDTDDVLDALRRLQWTWVRLVDRLLEGRDLVEAERCARENYGRLKGMEVVEGEGEGGGSGRDGGRGHGQGDKGGESGKDAKVVSTGKGGKGGKGEVETDEGGIVVSCVVGAVGQSIGYGRAPGRVSEWRLDLSRSAHQLASALNHRLILETPSAGEGGGAGARAGAGQDYKSIAIRSEAETLAREALGISVQQLGVHSAYVADGMKLLAQVLLQGHPLHRLAIRQSAGVTGSGTATASASTTPATAVDSYTTPPDPATTAMLHDDAAAEAIRLFEHALAIYQREKGETDLACADVLMNMANFYSNQARGLPAPRPVDQILLVPPTPAQSTLPAPPTQPTQSTQPTPPTPSTVTTPPTPPTQPAPSLPSLPAEQPVSPPVPPSSDPHYQALLLAAEAVHRAEVIYTAHRHPLTRTAHLRRQEIEGDITALGITEYLN